MGVTELLVYLDACVVIYLIEVTGPLRLEVARRLSDPSITVLGSGLVRMECMVGALKQGSPELLHAYRDFFGSISCPPIPDDAWDLAAALRAEYLLPMPDALHFAIAETLGCDAFWTADAHFERLIGRAGTCVEFIEVA